MDTRQAMAQAAQIMAENGIAGEPLIVGVDAAAIEPLISTGPDLGKSGHGHLIGTLAHKKNLAAAAATAMLVDANGLPVASPARIRQEQAEINARHPKVISAVLATLARWKGATSYLQAFKAGALGCMSRGGWIASDVAKDHEQARIAAGKLIAQGVSEASAYRAVGLTNAKPIFAPHLAEMNEHG